MTHMEKTQVYLPKEELDALREAAARSVRSVAEIIREQSVRSYSSRRGKVQSRSGMVS